MGEKASNNHSFELSFWITLTNIIIVWLICICLKQCKIFCFLNIIQKNIKKIKRLKIYNKTKSYYILIFIHSIFCRQVIVGCFDIYDKKITLFAQMKIFYPFAYFHPKLNDERQCFKKVHRLNFIFSDFFKHKSLIYSINQSF